MDVLIFQEVILMYNFQRQISKKVSFFLEKIYRKIGYKNKTLFTSATKCIFGSFSTSVLVPKEACSEVKNQTQIISKETITVAFDIQNNNNCQGKSLKYLDVA